MLVNSSFPRAAVKHIMLALINRTFHVRSRNQQPRCRLFNLDYFHSGKLKRTGLETMRVRYLTSKTLRRRAKGCYNCAGR